MSIIFDLFLFGLIDLFRDTPAKKQRREFLQAKKDKKTRTPPLKGEDDSMTYLIFDDLLERECPPVKSNFKYQEPPEDNLHIIDDDGPDW